MIITKQISCLAQMKLRFIKKFRKFRSWVVATFIHACSALGLIQTRHFDAQYCDKKILR